MNSFEITKETPRNIELAKSKFTFSKGISGWLIFGILIMVLGLGTFLSVFLPPHDKGLIFFKVIFFIHISILFWLIVKSYKKNISKRKQAFIKGDVLKATVFSHGRSMNPFRSRFNYTVTINLPLDNDKSVKEKIVSSDESIWTKFPLKMELTVLYDKSSRGILVAELWDYSFKVN